MSLTSSTITNTTSSDLYCIAHPTQVSVDPTVCLINSPLWADNGKIVTAVSGAVTSSITPQIQSIVDSLNNAPTRDDYYKAIQTIPLNVQTFVIIDSLLTSPIEQTISRYITASGQNSTRRDIGRATGRAASGITKNTPLGDAVFYLERILGSSINLDEKKTGDNFYLKSIRITIPQQSSNLIPLVLNGQAKQALSTLNKLSVLKPFFYNNQYSEIGIIKNIYINVEFLYKKALDGFIESQDTKEKNEINLYNYVKSIMREIQSAIGNLNNFEIHVDPVDNNVARVIDVNYTQPDKADKAKLFELQVHNLKSIVRTYSLQSKIFPNQSSLVAIGSQAKGGQLGMQNNTMIDFNKTLTDRIIPEKIFGGEKDSLKINNGDTTPVAGNLASIIKLYSALSEAPPPGSTASDPKSPTPSSTDTVDFNLLYSTAKNNLRDLIVYFQSIPNLKSTSANRNIIPIQFSFEMDGIGGLVIGHLFTINQDILPQGYKGPNLAQTVTRIGHTISNNDWVTKVEALNIVLNNKEGNVEFRNLNLTDIVNQSLQGAFATNQPTNNQPPPSQGPLQLGPCGPLQPGETPVGNSNTDVNYLIGAIINNIEGGYYNPSTHYSSFNSTAQALYATSGETMYGIDYVNGNGYRKYDPVAWDTFWYDIWTAQGYTVTGAIGRGISRSGTASRPWSWNYKPSGLPADKLYRLAAQFMSKAADDLFKKNNLDPNLERIIKSDGRLYYNFLYAVWNGPGWFGGWVKYISSKYTSGVTSSTELTKLYVEDRRNGGVGSIPNASSSAKQLISQGGQKICRHVGTL